MTNPVFQKIFNTLHDPKSTANNALNMRAVAQTFPCETKEWDSTTAQEYRSYANEQIKAQRSENK